MQKIVKSIPNFLTAANLFCGLWVLYLVWLEEIEIAFVLIGVCFVLDVLDGWAARKLNAVSEMGKELDSLADMVSSGAVPGWIMAMQIWGSLDETKATPEPWTLFLMSFGLLIPVFSAIRLARFNIDPDQQNGFKGLPTPANTALVASYWWVAEKSFTYMGEQVWVWLLLSCLSCYLLVSPWHLMKLSISKIKSGSAWHQLSLLILGALLLMIFGLSAIPLVILLYIGLSFWDKPVAYNLPPEAPIVHHIKTLEKSAVQSYHSDHAAPGDPGSTR